MKTKIIKIEGMSCHHCVKAVEVELEDLGVESFEVSIGSVVVKYDESKISDIDLHKAVEEAGFKPII